MIWMSETLDLLQELLGTYDGTVLLVSHDRDFLDRVAATTIAMEGDAQPRSMRAVGRTTSDSASKTIFAKCHQAQRNVAAEKPKSAEQSGLSFTEKHRLEGLPAEIAKLEAEIAKLEELMSDPALFTENPVKFQKATDALLERHENYRRPRKIGSRWKTKPGSSLFRAVFL